MARRLSMPIPAGFGFDNKVPIPAEARPSGVFKGESDQG